MKLFGKYKTKKQLRQENEKLKEEIQLLTRMNIPTITIERNIQKIKSAYRIDAYDEERIPTEYKEELIKNEIKKGLIDYIEPFIEYDFKTNQYGGIDYIGAIYIATGDRRNES